MWSLAPQCGVAHPAFIAVLIRLVLGDNAICTHVIPLGTMWAHDKRIVFVIVHIPAGDLLYCHLPFPYALCGYVSEAGLIVISN